MTDNPTATGTALAALVLQTQILHALLRTGTLPKPLMVAMMDAAILTVEEIPHDEGFSPEAIAFARKRLLDVQKLIEAAGSGGRA
ncbi:MAG: hypothetical protein ACRYG8_06025 [Janthinobacterium lividum]|jgi:hypothetical protein